ncbi:MAG: thioredoxin-disulfide reductase [Clostridia bacterium]|nr:thioredoxin-disulfide reductase [Clostridia bacterium]
MIDVLILGGGPAGYTAALYAARAGLSTTVVERMSAGGQMTLTGDIENYPGLVSVDGFTLGMQMQQGAEAFGAATHYAEVTSVELEGECKRVFTTDGVLEARTVIVATGANPRPLGLPSEADWIGNGVHYCAHCDGRFYKDKTVAVIGGGNSAVSDALYLSRICKTVYLVHRRRELRAAKVYHEALFAAPNVEVVWEHTVKELLATDRLTGIRLASTVDNTEKALPCDGVFVSIGREPVTAFLNGALPTDEHGYLVADETTQTPVRGVFAAGDVRRKALRQIVTATADGAVAAHFAGDYLEKQG